MPPHDEVRSRAELLRVIRSARLRWRLRLALRGLAALVAAALLVVILASYGLQYYAFTSGSVVAFRVIVWLLLAAVAIRFLVLPQLRSVSDERVALYIEEHEPSLEAALLSAVESTGARPPKGDDSSAALVARVVRDALERSHAVQDGRRIERHGLRVASAVLAVAVLAGLFAAARGPGYIRHGASALLLPWRGAEAVRPYHIEVSPGSVTVPRGADQEIGARLDGFSSGEAELLLRSGKDAAFDRVPMASATDEGAFRAIVFKVSQPTEYYVEAGGVRSPVYRIDVADLPYAKRLDIEYRFPAYTGLSPQTVEDGGDIAALKGTVARLRVFTTLPASGGRIVRQDGRAFPLQAADGGTLAGALPVDTAGVYHIELQSAQAGMVAASPDYTIQVLDDQPPTVAFEKPGRDTRATSIEELFLQARATDDYGIGRIDIRYSVNGGEERSLPLYSGGAKPLKEVSAGHTMYLEEMGLQPGDLVAYYARARDNGPAPRTATSDMYFVRIRSFRKDYHAADQRGMPGGGQQDQEGGLSEQQKQVIAATFNLLKDQVTLPATELKEHRATIALAQGRLREQVEQLVRRMKERDVASMDSTFAQILAILPEAAKEMKSAEEHLSAATSPREALPPEQRALQQLQRAEELYRDVQVSLQEQGGGSGGDQSAEDLADLFQLEMDRLRNQYETLERGQQEQQQQQLDEVLERLKELAKRQQQAAERQQRLARGEERAAGSGGGDAQRQLAEQVEEEARRLERLAHEDPQQGKTLEEGARQLRQAADALRRSASDPSGAGGRAAGERLDEARRLLQREREDRVSRAAQDARRRAEELAEEQHRIADEVERMGSGQAARDAESKRRLLERKDALAGGVDELEHRLDRLAADAHARDEESAKKIADAAKSMRDERVEDKIRASKGLVEGQAPEYARRLEDDISANLDSLGTRLAEAATSLAQAGAGARRDQDALDRARELARGVESLGQRLSDAGSRQGGQEGQDGGQGQDGQQGQSGEQGQGAQPGRSGQQGQGAQQQGGGGQGGEQQGENQAGANRFAPGGGTAGGPPGRMSAEDARQFRNEARQRLEDAQALERELSRDGRDTGDLRRAIEGLRALTESRPYADPDAIGRLQESAVQAVKEFEFTLRREIRGAEDGGVRLAAPQDVPEGFRSMVEEYFRSLARGRH